MWAVWASEYKHTEVERSTEKLTNLNESPVESYWPIGHRKANNKMGQSTEKIQT